ILLVLVMMVVTACGKEEVKEEVPPLESPPPAEEATPTPAPPTYPSLLSGVGFEEQNNTRPVAVLINNLAPARPQSGLTEADIIWEVLAEGGITRLIAIFQSTETADFDIGPGRRK